jgi:hypothetical protein
MYHLLLDFFSIMSVRVSWDSLKTAPMISIIGTNWYLYGSDGVIIISKVGTDFLYAI